MGRVLARRIRALTARGATSVEYGLLVALIAAGIIIAVVFFGDNVAGLFTDTNSSIDNAITP